VKHSIIKEFFEFMWKRKKMWMAPIIIIMLLIAVLILLTQGTAVAPFIYTLF
jgi:hypothetical protein